MKPRHEQILFAINLYMKKYNYSPSVREIGSMVGLKSVSALHRHLEILKGKGLIMWEPSKPRTLRLVDTQNS
ncbi:hypothetical protein Elgi_38280 [Paenibacillus elgii]|uniref:LexA family protein n=1 Tax=Paenibacillus elgii TaxID=189691 RepID=UPI000248D228|nr:hypothetical protein [Paenibacillus elgii]GMX64559.1 hypothetical protein Elgi_38280 [Paenibacillus elgii]